jgi:hypothetical protein
MKLLTSTLTTSTLILSTFAFNNAASAGGNTFVCGNWQGIPTTIARTAKGNVPVLRWESNHFNDSGFTPQKRCQIVSKKFQEYYSKGRLKYLTTGRSKGENVVCVAKYQNGPCDGILFTLKPGANPGETLKRLLDVRDRAGGPMNETDGRVYINMDKFLEEIPSNESNSNPTEVPTENSTPNNAPAW